MAMKRKLLSLLMVAVLVGMISVFAEAQQNVASVSKKGSLLVFPFIYSFSDNFEDTIVQIGNDSGSAVTVKCYWMDYDQNTWDFEFSVTPNQPVWFSAATGQGSIDVSPFGDEIVGELKCWAVDATTDPESVRKFNHLYGSAMYWFREGGEAAAFEYNAWAFALHNMPGDPSGPLTLNGSSDYDACPAYLSYNFFAYGASVDNIVFNHNFLALSPCQQDLRQDRSPVCTKAKFDIWNENETKFTGTYTCIKCTAWEPLTFIGEYDWGGCDLPYCKPKGVGGDKFLKSVIHTDMGRFRVTPSTFSACNGVFAQYDQDGKAVVDVCPQANQYQTPFVGVLFTAMYLGGSISDEILATTGAGAGAWTAPKPIPQILWDAGAGPAPAARR